MNKIKFKLDLIMLLIFLLTALNSFGNSDLKKKDNLPKNIFKALERLEDDFGYIKSEYCLIVEPSTQTLYLIKENKLEEEYVISTGKKGLGCEEGSFKTPIGVHFIKDKIGENAKIGTIFKARVNTKKIAKIFKKPVDVPDDYVTSRILRLSGCENGINKGKGVDSFKRFIYIHGTPEEGLLGTEASHGCIRMRNTDVVELFNKVKKGTLVYILDN